jgi:hypothetical protein
MFHSLSADTGISAILAGDIIKFTIPNNSIDTNKIVNLNVTEGKIAANAVTTGKIANGSITPIKLSGTLYSVATKTNIQSVPVNSKAMIVGLSATVTPPTNTAAVLINGYLSLGAITGGYTLFRRIHDVSPVSGTPIVVGDTSGLITRTTYGSIRSYPDNTVCTCPISFIDLPNTTNQVTYAIQLHATAGYISYVNRAYGESNNDDNVRTTSQIGALVLP